MNKKIRNKSKKNDPNNRYISHTSKSNKKKKKKYIYIYIYIPSFI